MNIYEKLSAISIELSAVAKNLEVGVGQNKYKAVGEADVLKAVKPLEAKYNVYSYPVHRCIIESGTIESEGIDYKTKEKVIKRNLFERIEVTYRFVNMEEPSEFIDIISYGDGIDSQDKSVGKAMTYADKYALLKAYKIITGEDPDQYASEDLNNAYTKKVTLDAQLVVECQRLQIDLNNVAKYFKKPVEALTNDDLKSCIETKQKALGGNK